MVKKVEVSSQHTKEDSDPGKTANVAQQRRTYEVSAKAARRKKVSKEWLNECKMLLLYLEPQIKARSSQGAL